MAQQVSIAEARADLSAYINRVAHGNQRIILTSRGRPKAALVSLEDLEAIEDMPYRTVTIEEAFAEADRLVDDMRRRRKGKFLPDSAETLWAIRDERMEQLMNPGAGE